MNLRYAVGAVTSDHGEMGHAHLPRWFLLDETHAPNAIALFWVAAPDVVEEAAIDLVDDLQMPWDQHLEQLDRPLLERFREQGVVRIREGAYGEVPGLLPPAFSLVEQEAHQFGDSERRVSVIELDGNVVRQRRPIIARAVAETVDDILQRATDHEVLLEEAQRPAGLGGVVGIEDPGERFGFHILNNGTHEVTLGKLGEVEGGGGGSGPEAQGVRTVGPIAHDGPVIGDSHERRRTVGDDPNSRTL